MLSITTRHGAAVWWRPGYLPRCRRLVQRSPSPPAVMDSHFRAGTGAFGRVYSQARSGAILASQTLPLFRREAERGRDTVLRPSPPLGPRLGSPRKSRQAGRHAGAPEPAVRGPLSTTNQPIQVTHQLQSFLTRDSSPYLSKTLPVGLPKPH